MYLTIRQIDMIAHLLNCGDWRTGDQLSEEFGLSKKTIQAEIKAISDSPVIGPEIEINPRKGYRLLHLTEESQLMLEQTIDFYGDTRNSVGVRPASLVLYLLFQNEYVSMQHLADAFFLSKTAISLEMETVRRWIDRQPELRLEVSGVHGIRIWATELRKRMYSVNHATRTAFGALPFPAHIHEQYIRYLDASRAVLQKIMPDRHQFLTGESMFQISRFIAISILRSGMGYHLDVSEVADEAISPIVDTLCDLLADDLEITLDEAERKSISLLVRISDRILDVPLPSFAPESLEDGLANFEHRVCETLGLAEPCLFQNRAEILTHLQKMMLRAEKRQIAVNHYNEEIIRHYPLATHLAHRFLPECFGLEITKETSFFTLFVQEALYKLEPKPNVLLICNQNVPVARQIESWLRRKGNIAFGKFDVLPAYAIDSLPDTEKKYDILLTTQEETLVLHPEFYLLPPIMTQKEMAPLNFFVKTILEEKGARRLNTIRENCLHEETVEPVNADVFSIIGCPDDGTMSFHLYSSIYLHIARFKPTGSPAIHFYHLKNPIMFRHKRVRELIFTEFARTSENLMFFDRAVADILCEQP